LIADKAKKLTGLSSQIEHTDFPKSSYIIEERNSVADSTQFRNATGWSPKITLELGIQKALEKN